MGLVVRVNVREEVLSAGVGKWLTVWVVVDVGKEMSSNDPAVVLRHLGSRNPSGWSVGPGSI